MKLIFAVDKNWSIGVNGDMLVHLSNDLKRFKEITMGGILVMGRKTFESLPNQKPLPGRTSLVVTTNKDYRREGITVVNSLEELFKKLEEINPEKERQVFLIGGGNLVDQLIDKCDYAHITKIDHAFPDFDTAIPNLDKIGGWEVVSEGESLTDEKTGYKYKHFDYKRIGK